MVSDSPASPRPFRIKLGLRTWRTDIAFLGANVAVSVVLAGCAHLRPEPFTGTEDPFYQALMCGDGGAQ